MLILVLLDDQPEVLTKILVNKAKELLTWEIATKNTCQSELRHKIEGLLVAIRDSKGEEQCLTKKPP